MITSFDKAIVAVLGLALYGLETFMGISLPLGEDTLTTIAVAVTPLLVWMVPNKPADE